MVFRDCEQFVPKFRQIGAQTKGLTENHDSQRTAREMPSRVMSPKGLVSGEDFHMECIYKHQTGRQHERIDPEACEYGRG